VALKNDGTVVTWGNNEYGQATLPAGLNGVTAVAAGCYQTMALKNDGTVISNGYTVPAGLSGVIAIAAGCYHSAALKNDGTVVIWGDNAFGQNTVPPGLIGVAAIAAGFSHTVALKNDGTVVAWGDNGYGQCSVPAGLSGVIAIAAGQYFTVALKSDGTIATWGWNYYGQTTVPEGLTDISAIAVGAYHTVARKSDGTVVTWGYNNSGQTTVPANPYTADILGTLIYYSGSNTATFIPFSRLPSSANLIATVNTGVRSVGGFHLAADFSWSFRTGAFPQIIASPTSLNAGDVNVGSSSSPIAITLRNSGTADLGVGAVTLFGLETGMFSISPGTCGNLTPTITAGESCTLNMVFAPTSTGPKNATLRVMSNDPTTSSLDIPLSGSGLAPMNVLSISAGGNGSGSIALSTGGNCIGSCSQSFGTGTVVVLTPTADTGSVFRGWSGCDSVAGNQCTVTMNWAKDINATFNLIPAVIAVIPTNNATNIPVTATVAATFSEAMDPFTINSASFTMSYFAGIKAVAAGGSHTVALRTDGTAVAWGTNYSGQTNVPAGLAGVTAIAAGGSYTVALREDGKVVAWGDNYYGQTAVPAGLGDVIAVAAGQNHTMALKSNGKVITWGNGFFTELPTGLDSVIAIAAGGNHSVALKNDGTVIDWGAGGINRSVPAGLSDVIAIAAGYDHTFALKSDGSVVAWGDNTVGQATVPADLSGVIAVAAGTAHCVALKGDGTVVAWGSNTNGQTTVPAGLSGVIAITGGGSSTVALKNDGTVVAWGANGCGQSTVPTEIRDISAIAAGGGHTLALKNDGTLTGWGDNSYGQLTIPAGLNGVAAIATGYHHTVALKSDGTVVAWGFNLFGQTTVPAGLNGVKSIAAGAEHTVALKNDGTVVAWGDNSSGKCTVPNGLSGVMAIAAGGQNTMALKNDGTVVVWGANHFGQANIPAGLSGVIDIAAGYYHMVALKGDGTVVAWGWNPDGQTTVPVGLSGVIAVKAGQYHTVALKSDGTVVAWGANAKGITSVPAWLSDVIAIAAGSEHTVALKSDGTLVAWGSNYCGESTVPASPYMALLSGIVSYDSDSATAIYTPFSRLPSSTALTATVNTRATSQGGVHLPTDYSWGFNTGAFPYLRVTPNSLNMGSINLGGSSPAMPITFQNKGAAPLTVSDITIDGIDAGMFSVSKGTCESLSPTIVAGMNCMVLVSFTPAATGYKNALLKIASNDPVHPITSVSITGSGYDSAPFGSVVINNGATITGNSSVNLTLSAYDNTGVVSDMRFSNNNYSWSDWELYGTSKTWTLMALGGDGIKTVYVQFRDAAGVVSGSFSDTIFLDTMPPVLTITSMPDNLSTSSTATFSFSASEPVTGYECRIDSSSYEPCISPKSFSGLSEGSHTFHLRAVNLVGNTAETSYTWTITTNPVAMINGANTTYYSNVGGAFAAIPLAATTTIKVLALDLIEALTLNVANTIVTLNGGYNCNFASADGMTSLKGSLTINDGTLIVGNLVIK
jgi:alpha-tubulin suppressor-like RCC1 family protein